jgi:hypothetical protein
VLTEVRTRAKEYDQRGAWAIAWTATTLLALDVHSLTIGGSACGRGTPTDAKYIPDPDFFELGQPPNNPPGEFNRDMIRRCNAEDERETDLLGMPCFRESWTSAATRSLHPGGVHGLFGDNSVRFVPDQVNVGVFARQICINDGLPIADYE